MISNVPIASPNAAPAFDLSDFIFTPEEASEVNAQAIARIRADRERRHSLLAQKDLWSQEIKETLEA